MPASGPFAVPLTFPIDAEIRTDKSSCNIIEKSYSNSEASCLLPWSVDSNVEPHSATHGLAVGSQDGSLYIFHPARVRDESQSQKPQAVGSASHMKLNNNDSHNTSRSVSPSIFSPPPFQITGRSKIVTGITTEKVEAPTNYVDFDDEPGKLKDILQGHIHKEKPEPVVSSDKATVHKEPPKSLLSATNSPSFTPRSLSVPSSPTTQYPVGSESENLRLLCHVIPPNSGTGHSVSGLNFVGDGPYLAMLQESGHLSIVDITDGACLSTVHVDAATILPPAGMAHDQVTRFYWTWKHLKVIRMGELKILLISATTSAYEMTDEDEEPLQKSRLAIFCLTRNRSDVRLEKFGQWHFDGPASSCGIHSENDATFSFYYVTWEGHFIVQKITILPPPVLLPVDDHTEKLLNIEINLDALSKPFKAMKSPSEEDISIASPKEPPSRIQLDEPNDLGLIQSEFPWCGFTLRSCTGNVPQSAWLKHRLRGIAWSDKGLVAFKYGNNGFRNLFVSPVTDVTDVRWVDDITYAIIFSNRVETFSLKPVDANNDEIEVSPSIRNFNIQPVLRYTLPITPAQTLHVLSPSELLTTENHNSQRGEVKKASVADEKPTSRALWRAPRDKAFNRLTSILPLELTNIILGYADGRLRHSSIPFMLQNANARRYDRTSEPPIDGFILAPHLVQNGRTKEQFILAGADDGSIAFWHADTLKMCARWVTFITPLRHVLQFPDSQGSPLRGCVLCVSEDGSIAVIAVDGFQFLYLIPGAASTLQRVCLGEDNLLLSYADQRARLWDVKTREFWRSMSAEKAEELLGQGGWTDMSIPPVPRRSSKALGVLSSCGLDSVATLVFDLENLITESTTIIKSISSSRNQTRTILSTRDRLRSILSTLVTPGLNADIDEVCHERLGVPRTSTFLGYSSNGGFTSLYAYTNYKDPWCISGDVSAARALSICSILRALSLFEEMSDSANTMIAFYATSLSACVGSLHRPPSLSFLAMRWFDSSNELRLAARTLFDAAVARLSDEETNAITEEWQHGLPCLQPTADRESSNAALALFLCGYIATEKYSLMLAGALTDISKSISLYLNDEQSKYRVLAIDLCSKGFHIWQHYIDAMDILRALFTLATSSKKEGITVQNVGAQARLAVLQIASSNTPLFMTTLSLDIITPASLEHRKSVMQILAFLIRKRPLVLSPNLPKLLEAVVKSLDPNATSYRDAVIDTATEILGHVVKTFPSIDFHMSTQRLAVGTSEGALIMYDLKTAIRLYVLEGHKKSVTACSFSPDGRRLVTLCLEESVVLVWKVGSSFSSFFNPGAPPRQGHGGNEPFKTLSFNVGDAAKMTQSETLELVRFDWPADRSVKLRIKESMLTFST